MKTITVTTSWDDGHALDMRLGALLQAYNMPGTFYIAPRDREFPLEKLLSDEQVRALANNFEIGAHTITHPRLPHTGDAEAYTEITKSKAYLEQVTGKPVVSFCYPRGEYEPTHVDMVSKAGFTYARTVLRHSFENGSALEARTTLHCYDHWSDIWQIAKFSRFNPITFVRYFRHWDTLAMAMFDRALERGGVYHLWGHSWELEKNGDWARLERVLAYISNRPGVLYATNGELV